MLRNLSSAHDGPVWALQRTAEVPEAVASAGADGMVKLWDARQVKPAGQVQTGNAVYALAMSRGTLISSGYDGIVQLWDIRMGSVSLAASLQAHRAPVRALVVESKTVWSGSTDGTVRCWDLDHLLKPRARITSGLSNRQAFEHYVSSGVIENDLSEENI
ncbi:hypothetical protein AB1Y20_002084 [Prymnesium parvum]|uniref:Guanine nucleotide-binding protein subunit beta-like protein n=1 Tax=Prymnesium parvum TaxID=97485 RepID=A0AB34JAJ8_PRYPA